MKVFKTLLFVLFTTYLFSQHTPSELGEIDTEVKTLIKQYQAVGLAVAVVKNDKVIYSKGFGYRNLEEKLPVTQHTAFHIASMSKAFTGALLGILERDNYLSLKDRPAVHVPNFQFYNDKMNHLIAIEDLLSHKSGLGTHGLSIVLFPEKDKLKTVQRLKYLKPEDEIKNSWNYSNLGYTLAGTIVEQVTKKTWDSSLQEMLFKPLQMNASSTTVEVMKKSGDYALGYGKHKGKTVKRPFENYYAYTPAGAIKSSVTDLSNWMRVWLDKGVYNGTQVIPEDYIRKATSLQNTKYNVTYDKDSFLFGEGFGWRLRAWFGHYRIRHGGNTNGFSSVMDMFPFENIGIVVLCNQQSSLLPYAISDDIARRLLGLPTMDYPVDVGDVYMPEPEDQELQKDKMPIHPLKDFSGTYTAAGYGKIEIKEEEASLLAVLPTYTFKLTHLNFNTFYLKGLPNFDKSFNPEFTVKFDYDTKGGIYALQILGAQKEAVVFLKD